MQFRFCPLILGPLSASIAAPAYAVQYLTVEEAQHLIFPDGQIFESSDLRFSEEEINAARQRFKFKTSRRFLRCWEVKAGGRRIGHFVLDEVIGKHEEISYAVGISADGKIIGVEILEYREKRGSEVKDAAWRTQFVGKSVRDRLKVGDDIRNISGATLSCIHLTEGLRQILALFEVKHAAG